MPNVNIYLNMDMCMKLLKKGNISFEVQEALKLKWAKNEDNKTPAKDMDKKERGL